MLNISKIGNDFAKISADFTLETDRQKVDESNLGKQSQACKLCNSSGEFQTWRVAENYFGTCEEFIYFECPKCETLQICSYPADMEKYYPSNYYSYSKPDTSPAAPGTPLNNLAVLDVGCGSGSWLCSLAKQGFIFLHGCDPFAAQDYDYENGVKIKKCSIHEMDGEYDLIRMSHVFEHMPDPDDVFASLNRLLRRQQTDNFTPYVEINIPIFPNIAFDIYGPFWYQVDAPRHFFLHSIKSITALAEAHGFKIHSAKHDCGNYLQFIISRMYQMGIPFMEWQKRLEMDRRCASIKSQIDMYKLLSHIAGENSYSDTVCILLVRG